jgi:ferritin-like metal-binding protein YciE
MNTLDNINRVNDNNSHRKADGSVDGSSVDEKADAPQISNAKLNKVTLESSVEAQLLTVGIEGGRRVFAKSLETNFNLSISVERPEFEFKLPSPSDVAQTVLGFVERRIDSEVRSGADEARVSDLLNQARKGVEAGFASALDDIESLGLLNEELEGEIGESRNLIDTGIDQIEEKYIGPVDSSGSNDSSEPNDSSELNKVSNASEELVEPDTNSRLMVDAFEFFTSNLSESASSEAAVQASALEHKFASHQKSEFALQTRDGDIVSIRFSDSFASIYQASEDGVSLAASSEQAFEFSVEGELDESELEAINNLLSQVGEVAELFFSNQFQDAFVSALSVGFDSTEIAAFTLDLTKSVSEELRSYGRPSTGQGQGGDLASVRRYMPLVEMTNHFSQINEMADIFEAPRESIASLIKETLERVQDMMNEVRERLNGQAENSSDVTSSASSVSVSQFVEFSRYVLLSENV